MKVLIVNALYAPHVVGGAERSVQFIAEALVERGHEAVVVSTGPEAGVATRVLGGVRVYDVGVKNLYWPFQEQENAPWLKPAWHAVDAYNPWMAQRLQAILVREQPDVVHTNNLIGFSAAAFKAVKRAGYPLVHTLRDYYLLCSRGTMFRNGENCEARCWSCRAHTLPRRHLSGLADAVVGNSRFILDCHLQHGYFADTPHRAVVFNAYDPPAAAGRSASAGDSSGSRVVRLGYLGRLSPTKGIAYLLDFCTSQLPEGGWELFVAGTGDPSYEQNLRRHYTQDTVHFMGYVRPEELFATIDVLVVPSLWHEPLPRTVYEAYAHGLPVIGSDRGGTPEIIEAGATGFVFDPDRTETLRRAVRAFAQEPALAARMRTHIREKAKAFLPEQTLQGYLKVYQRARGNAVAGAA